MALEAAAEIERQLVLQGGRGYVQAARWMEKYKALGSMRTFMDHMPEKFRCHSGVGVGGSVLYCTLVDGEDETAHMMYNDHSAAALKEIKAQLDVAGGEGKVQIDDWWQRYGILGDLRDFIETRPDQFEVLLGGETDFAVRSLFPGPAASRGRHDLPPELREDDPTVGQALNDIELELRTSGGECDLELFDWQPRYGHLCDLRSFVRAFPDKFVISPTGRGLIVGLLAQIDLDSGHPLIDEAASEIAAYLHARGGFARVRIDGWDKRFGQLGPFQAFLEHFPDAFHVVRGQGDDFAVGLASLVQDDYLEIDRASGKLKRTSMTYEFDQDQHAAKRMRTEGTEEASGPAYASVDVRHLFRRC